MEVSTALLSLYDKSDIIGFAKELQNIGINIICTSGTADYLEKRDIDVEKISEVTDCEEILDGRVKTLNQEVHGGILADRSDEDQMKYLKGMGIESIDLVVVNFYPVEEKIERERPVEKVIENTDIGGPTMVRAATKNYRNVGVVVKPDQYEKVINDLKQKGDLSIEIRKELAVDALSRIVDYNESIYRYFKEKFSDE